MDLVWKVLCANRLGNKASELQMVMEKLKLSSWVSQDLTICIERTSTRIYELLSATYCPM